MRFIAVSILLSFTILPSAIFAQRVLRGTVSDAESGESLPAVALYIEETGEGTITNAVGMFELRLLNEPARILVRHIGYETSVFTVDSSTPNRIDIQLQPATYELEEVFVSDEDPAYNIMRKVIERKNQMFDGVGGYMGEAYSRFMLYSDFNLVQVQETIANHYWRNGSGTRSLVRARRIKPAAIKPMRFATTQNVPNFYDDSIEVLGFNLVGPTHPDALDVYIFTLGGYRQLDGRRVYDIYFTPRTGFETAFVGYVSVLDEEYVLLEAGMRPSPDNVVPAPVQDWDVYYEQQFAPIGDSLWVPVDLRVEGHVSFGRVGVSYPTARYRQVSRITKQAINVPAPDSLYAMDRLIAHAPNVDRQDYLFRWNPGLVPMTPKEIEEVVNLNPRMTMNRAFRPIGMFAQYAAVSLEEEPAEGEQEVQESLIGGMFSSFRFFYDRVNGFYLGLERELDLSPALSLGLRGGYGLSIDEPAYGVSATYNWGRLNEPAFYPNRGYLQVGFDRDRATQYNSGVYSRLTSSLTTYVGWEDYFDYYQREARYLEAGVTSDKLNTTLSFGISDEEHSPVSRNRDNKGWFFGSTPRENPEISRENYTLYKAGLTIGESPETTLYANRANGLRIGVTHNPGEMDRPVFTRYEVRGSFSIPTFYRRRIWPNALHIRTFAATYSGSLPSQWSSVLDVSRRPIAPFGAFKTLNGLPIKGEQAWSIFWEHDFATALFEWLGMWRVAQLGLGVRIHGGHGRMYSRESLQDAYSRYVTEPQHEMGISLTHLFNLPIRFDVTRNFTSGHIAFGIGLTGRYSR